MRIWTEDAIKDAVSKMVASTGQMTFPTHSEMERFYKNNKLSNAVKRNGGTTKWANIMNMPEKECESRLGKEYEIKFLEEMTIKGHKAIKTEPRYPYDVLVDGAVKVDVKASRSYKSDGKTKFYSINLQKSMQTCDIFVAYCIDDDNSIKTYVIPSSLLSGQTQLGIGYDHSIYDKYLNRWDIIESYIKFMKEIQ